LSSEIAKVVKLASVLDRLVNDGPIPVGSSPDEFQAFIKAKYNKRGKVMREAKLKTE
jgi:tripartite-type tricarboxylate transporter receptor subunit TctC